MKMQSAQSTLDQHAISSLFFQNVSVWKFPNISKYITHVTVLSAKQNDPACFYL
jgi:hypothetical protein